MKHLISTIVFAIINHVFSDYINIDYSNDPDSPVYVDPGSDLNTVKTKVEIVEYGRYDEVFSDHIVQHNKKQIQAHISSSSEDIIDMCRREKDLIKKLTAFIQTLESSGIKISNLAKLKKTIGKLSHIYQDYTPDSCVNIVKNPVAAFHVIWRTARLWPQKIKALMAHHKLLKSQMKNQKNILQEFPAALLTGFPVNDNVEMAAGARGLLTIQHHYNISCHDLVSGLGDSSWSLSVEQMMEVATTAQMNSFMNLAVDWYQAALDKTEDKKMKSKLRDLVTTAQEKHDGHIVTNGYLEFDKSSKKCFSLNDHLFDTELEESETFQKLKTQYNTFRDWCSRDVDIGKEAAHRDTFWMCMYSGLEEKRRQLCQLTEPVTSPTLHCSLLHHSDPYSVLAPFKFEQIKIEPFVGVLVDIVSDDEMEVVKEEARGKMITTTLVDYHGSDENVKDDYTSRRTSKVTYRSDKAFPRPLASWTQRIELATRLGEIKSFMIV